MTRPVVYVLDAWNETTQASLVRVFSTAAKARAALERLDPNHVWYAAVVRRVVL